MRLDAPHLGKTNVLYSDGHARTVVRDQIVDHNDSAYTTDAFRKQWDPLWYGE